MINRQRMTCTVDLGINPHLAIEAAMDSRTYGIWYWAYDGGYVKSRKAWFIREDLSDGSTGAKWGPKRYIYREDIERGCRLMAKQHPQRFAQLLDELKIDAPLGDLLIQLAVYGEAKYG